MNTETPLSTVAYLRACTHSTFDFHRMEAIARIHGAADRMESLENALSESLDYLKSGLVTVQIANGSSKPGLMWFVEQMTAWEKSCSPSVVRNISAHLP